MHEPKLRIGIIGGGGIVRHHLPQLKKRTDVVEVVAVADVKAEAAKGTAEEFSIARYATDYHEWLGDVDAVVIAVPTHLHHTIGIECANAGKHIFMEKPLTRTREQAKALMEAVERNGVQLQVGFARRFHDEWMAWREVVLKSKIGRPVSWRHVQSGYNPPSPWFNQEEQGGGPFLDGCIHNLDFALYTFGPAEWAFANLRTMQERNTAFDTGTATVRFQTGDELMLAWTWGLPESCTAGANFDIVGPKGTIVHSSNKSGEWDVNSFVLDTGQRQEAVPYSPTALVDAFNRQMDEFITVAQGKGSPRAGAREGFESLKLALAILQSGRTGEVVRLESPASEA